MVVNVWLMCLEFPNGSESLLAIRDNASAIGWLFLSSRIPPDLLYYNALQLGARKLAMLITSKLRTLPCLPTYQRRSKLGYRPPLLVWWHLVGCRGSKNVLRERLSFNLTEVG